MKKESDYKWRKKCKICGRIYETDFDKGKRICPFCSKRGLRNWNTIKEYEKTHTKGIHIPSVFKNDNLEVTKGESNL
jgi:rRNA maturation endonuclease Nob1